MKFFQISQTQSSTEGCDSDAADRVRDQRIAVQADLVAIAESFEKKERSWFVTSKIPTDLTIQVHDITFYVHQYPLLSRCGYLRQLDLQPSDSNLTHNLKIESFPGGPDSFEIVLKYCYGLPIDLTLTNVASLRCASELLEMTEDFEEGNLIFKTEAFLTFVLSSWRNSIAVLKSCEPLSPWAESLQIVRRCCESIVWKASRDDEPAVNGDDDAGRSDEKEPWFDDVSVLRIDHFVRIATAMRAKGVAPEVAGGCIAHYAKRWLPGLDGESESHHRGVYDGRGGRNELKLSILSGRKKEESGPHNKERRMMTESLVSILPPHREAVSCGFLLWMLKMAVVYSAAPALVSELEKRVGIVLEDATVTDLLIPKCIIGDGGLLSSVAEESTTHDVDVVQRIVEYFLMHERKQHQQKCAMMAVGKLLDGFLAEIARDPNLSIAKFQHLAEALPGNARTCDDGLYRAIDIYLKTHPSLMEHERRKLCRVMDCEKLSLDACLHAAQNERLPLRTVVQVLFTEQVKMRVAIQGKDLMQSERFGEHESNISSTNEEIKSLRTELENMKTKVEELQRDYSELQQEFDKLISRQKSRTGWSSGWRKMIKNSAFFNPYGKMDTQENGGAMPHKHMQQGLRSRRATIS